MEPNVASIDRFHCIRRTSKCRFLLVFVFDVMNFGELLLKAIVSVCCRDDFDSKGSRFLRRAENHLPDCTVSLPEHMMLVLKVRRY